MANILFIYLMPQYFLQWHNDSINYLIEQAILEADKKGIEVFSLGLMNQVSVSFFFFFSYMHWSDNFFSLWGCTWRQVDNNMNAYKSMIW